MDDLDIMIAEHHVLWISCFGKRIFLMSLFVSWMSERAQFKLVNEGLLFFVSALRFWFLAFKI